MQLFTLPKSANSPPQNLAQNDNRLIELQHFAELGRVCASLLHEISNPLTAAMLHLELSDRTSPAFRQIKKDLDALRRYVMSARQQIRNQSEVTSFCIDRQILQLKQIVLPLANRCNVSLQFGAIPKCKLYGDPVKFQQIVANLIVNAIESYQDVGVISQRPLVRISFVYSRSRLKVKVQDWGKGIAPSSMPKLFEPFYTTKDHPARGLGIGLSIVKQYVVNDFNGSLHVRSSRRRGTAFTARLVAQDQRPN